LTEFAGVKLEGAISDEVKKHLDEHISKSKQKQPPVSTIPNFAQQQPAQSMS